MLITSLKACFPSWCKFSRQSVIESDLLVMNAKKVVLLFRERHIHFWEANDWIMQINEHFKR